MGKHSEASLGARHPLPDLVYADSTERLAATGFTSADIWKAYGQTSDGSLWILTDYSPITWVEITHTSVGITGPGSSTDNAVVRWDGTGGDTTQNSVVVIDDTGIVTGVVSINSVVVENHSARHEYGGSDVINVASLSGVLADAQTVIISKTGTPVGTRTELNFIEGSNVTLTVTDNSGESRVDVTVAASGSGDVSGPGSSTDNAIVRWDGTSGDTVQNSVVIISDTGDITGVGTVDGRDISTDGSNLDSHISATNNPHSTDLGNLGTGTLSELNSVLTDALIPDCDTSGNVDMSNQDIINARTITFNSVPTLTPSAGSVTCAFDDYQKIIVNLNNVASVTININVPVGPGNFMLELIQGSVTPTTTITWVTEGTHALYVTNATSGTIPVQTGTSQRTLLGLWYDGSIWHVTAAPEYLVLAN